MTALMKHDHMQQVAQIVGEPSVPAQRVVPTLRWDIDPTSGRPVSHWVIEGPTLWTELSSGWVRASA